MVAQHLDYVNRTGSHGLLFQGTHRGGRGGREVHFLNTSLAAACQKLQPFAGSGRLVDIFKGFSCGLIRATSAGMHPIDEITDQIIGAAIEVHQKFGPGLLESVYTNALGAELVARGLDVHISKPVSLEHEGLHTHRAFVIDLLVNERVVVEVKSVQKLTEIDFAQTLTYLRLMDLRVGLLINFNVPLLELGIRRVVNRHVDEDGNKLRVSTGRESIEDIKEKIDPDRPP